MNLETYLCDFFIQRPKTENCNYFVYVSPTILRRADCFDTVTEEAKKLRSIFTRNPHRVLWNTVTVT